MQKKGGNRSRDVLLTDSLQLNYSGTVAGNRIWLKKFPLTNQLQKNLSFELKSSPACYETSFLDRFENKTILLTRSQPHHSLNLEIKTKVKLNQPNEMEEKEASFSIDSWQKKKISPALEEFCAESAQVLLTPVTKRIAESLARTAANDWKKTITAIRNWVACQMKYKPGVTETATLSAEALRLRQGVCQDITHVFLSLLRSLKIPARYVSGYQVGGTEMHSWAEVYFPAAAKNEGKWKTFDPTEPQDHLPKIAVAIGRDYQDARPIAGIFHSANGKGELISKIKVEWIP